MGRLLLLLLAAVVRADEPKTVCATRPLETLPAGVVFGASDAFLAKARDQVAKEPSSMRRSAYETQTFAALWDARVTWADGSQVSVSCTLSATLHQLENRRFAVLRTRAETKTSPYAGAGQPPDWLKVIYELDDGEIQFPASLTCEAASARQDAQHPYAPAERQHVAIGVLQNLLFETFPLRIRTETDPRLCAAP